MEYSKITLIYSAKDEELLTDIDQKIDQKFKIKIKKIELNEIKENLALDKGEINLLFLSDEDLKELFCKDLKGINIAILPHKENPDAQKSYGISSTMDDALEDAFEQKQKMEVDLLLCNGWAVFEKVKIGDMHDLHRYRSQDISLFKKWITFLNNLKNISYKSVTFKFEDEKKIDTAVSGILVVEHTTSQNSQNIDENLSFHDKKLNAFILAPTSLISYWYYLILIIFYRKFSTLSLPKSFGFIRTSSLTIGSHTPFDFTNDRAALSAKEIFLEIKSDALTLHLGRKIENKNGTKKEDEEDVVRVNSLPKGEIRKLLIDGKVPLFKKAEVDEFKELFSSLRASSKFTSIYFVLMILSTLLATVGLFQNSTPVIIGAMVLAPLMSPIISLAMGAIRAEKELISKSIITLALGIITALVFSSLFTIFVPLEIATDEMKSRLNPNTLDLMVAIFSGIAGAYAHSKSEVAKSLAGVAIAVALVPPLSVTGVGIGWGDFDIIYGSFLLFITNLVGITLFASFTFIVLGFSPIKRAKKGLIYTSILLLIIAIPLGISFGQMITQSSDFSKIRDIKELDLGERSVEIRLLDVVAIDRNSVKVEIEVTSRGDIDLGDFEKIKEVFENRLEKDISLEINSKILI